MSIKRNNNGDTIIEVMFATALAGLVIVIALSSMNRSLAQLQMAVETTFVRQAMDGEAEAIRFIRDQYMNNKTSIVTDSPAWLWRTQIIHNAKDSSDGATAFGSCDALTNPSSNKAFVVKGATTDGSDPDADGVGTSSLKFESAGSITPANTYAQLGRGIWVEAVRGGTSSQPYIDFHIRACWEPPYGGSSNATLGTIVRQSYE